MILKTIKLRSDFLSVLSLGSTIKTEIFILKRLFNKSSEVKVGISVSKKCGNAVVRNKIKRRLRHIIKNLNLKSLRAGLYIFIIKKGDVATVNFAYLNKAVISTFEKS